MALWRNSARWKCFGSQQHRRHGNNSNAWRGLADNRLAVNSNFERAYLEGNLGRERINHKLFRAFWAEWRLNQLVFVWISTFLLQSRVSRPIFTLIFPVNDETRKLHFEAFLFHEYIYIYIYIYCMQIASFLFAVWSHYFLFCYICCNATRKFIPRLQKNLLVF